MTTCLVCDSPVDPIMTFGRMPIANGFIHQEDLGRDEYFFELKVGLCRVCKMVQLTELVDREKMFHAEYPFFSSTSARMAAHFEQFADDIAAAIPAGGDPFIVELGSNDGIMLRHFARRGWRHLGIEPSANVAEVARQNGIATLCEFFDEALAARLVDEHGQADAITAANVMCHIPDLNSVAKGVRRLLKPTGIFAFEDPYLGDIIAKTSYDQIYDEHAFYFSLMSIQATFEPHGLQVIDVRPQAVHGGEMRYVLAHRGAYPVAPAVTELLERERQAGLDRLETFIAFAGRVAQSKEQLMSLLRACRAEGRRVVGYAATSKSTTVTNYCGITPELVEFISDSTPIKQGCYSPGAHIPVRPPEAFRQRYPEYALLFGWNHRDEIMEKEEDFRRAGGKWIVYVPKVEAL